MNLIKKFLYSKPTLWLCRTFFSMFYDNTYLRGKFFEEKRMGWIWALKGIPGKILGNSKRVPWPVGKNTIVSNCNNIEFDNSSINVFQMPGCYFQCHKGKIVLGKNIHIAPNCGIITTNHDVYNPDKHVDGKDVIIGDKCWIGMNSVILPGVILGDNTIVGAGSVVTKSFQNGYCVIAGTPAKLVYELDRNKVEEVKGKRS